MINADNRTLTNAAPDNSASKAAFWIDDPFGSIVTGIAIPAAAVSTAVAIMWTLALTLA